VGAEARSGNEGREGREGRRSTQNVVELLDAVHLGEQLVDDRVADA